MTKTEMTELFAVMSLAWPNSNMFRNGLEDLGPTIALWTSCLSDLDYSIAQRAMLKLCRERKFPPTVAELRDAAKTVEQEMRIEAETAYMHVRSAVRLSKLTGQTPGQIYRALPVRSRKVIDAMGGMEAFVQPDKPCFNMEGFVGTYERFLRNNPVGLPGAGGKKIKQPTLSAGLNKA